MKRPRYIWLFFALSLAVVLAAMGWISWVALRYERSEARALAKAEFEEDVRLALWRMDALSLNWPRHVRLNVRISTDGKLTSPAVPELAAGNKRLQADAQGDLAQQRLDELARLVTRGSLAAKLREGLAAHGPPLRIAVRASGSEVNQLLQPGQRTRRATPQQNVISNAQFAARDQSLRILSQNNAYLGTGPDGAGTTNPVWVNGQLLLVHRGEKDDLHGAWVDWAKLRQVLLADVATQFPRGELRPAATRGPANPHRHLAVLPAVFLPGRVPTTAVAAWTPLRTSLAVAWGCVLLAATAVVGLLLGVLRLAERRAAFVSAVTHELRTPLTTFRMYAEMLAGGMVPDAGKRQEYHNTLRIESDRLEHLVENVLSYARLERGRPKRQLQTVPVADLVAGVEPRLRERTGQTDKELKVEVDPSAEGASVRCDPSVVEQILFNLVDNACKYATGESASVIRLELVSVGKKLALRIRDGGPGISVEQRRRLFQPFSKSAQDAAHSAPGVGLGLALSRRLARAMGGDLRFDADYADGAAFSLTLPRGV